ncbi:MAG TPA: hypothetical protein VJN21_13555 [Candidatus Acidoferrales bacterium]|nr:hypothetical protein [Candidatus Acidoferrales bacterium]
MALALLLLFVFVYVYLKLWRDRNLQGLHTPLAILGGAIALLLIVAVAARRLRPKKRDDKSVLHL